jgi:hypothetical protein
MVFLISNYNKNEPFKISENNNLSVIESSIENLTFKAIESNSPVQFFVSKSSNINSSFKSAELEKAKLFTIETYVTENILQNIEPLNNNNNTNSFVNLITDFGDKKSKEYISKKGMRTYIPNQNLSFNIQNQILPLFNKDSKDPKECFSLSDLFDGELIDSFNNVEVVLDDSCLFVRTIFKENLPLHMSILDCLYKVLSTKAIFERSLGKYKFYYQSLKEELTRDKLTPILKDKLIVKFIITALLASNFELVLDQIPRFGETLNKITTLCKMVGCTITKNGRVRLDSMPMESFTSKKFKKN